MNVSPLEKKKISGTTEAKSAGNTSLLGAACEKLLEAFQVYDAFLP